jgi:hypothetical protein
MTKTMCPRVETGRCTYIRGRRPQSSSCAPSQTAGPVAECECHEQMAFAGRLFENRRGDADSVREEAKVEYVGIDWATRRAAWCALNGAGEVVGGGVVPADLDGVLQLVARAGREVTAAVEMMSGAAWVAETLDAADWRVQVADSRRARALSAVSRDDRQDRRTSGRGARASRSRAGGLGAAVRGPGAVGAAAAADAPGQVAHLGQEPDLRDPEPVGRPPPAQVVAEGGRTRAARVVRPATGSVSCSSRASSAWAARRERSSADSTSSSGTPCLSRR